jgi:hypothetical protein
MTETKPADVAATKGDETKGDAVQGSETQGAEGEQPAPVSHHQKDGRYIPYSGGSMGWFENSGVLNSERMNNYVFRTAMDGDLVRAKQYQRAGMQTEKRRSERKALAQELSVTLKSAREEHTVRVGDLSAHGMKVNFAGDQIHLNRLDKVSCRFPPGKGGVPALELECIVIHAEKTGRSRTVWIFGLDFGPMSPAQAAALAKIGGFES